MPGWLSMAAPTIMTRMLIVPGPAHPQTSSFRNNVATAEAMWEQLLPGMHAGSIVSVGSSYGDACVGEAQRH